MKYMTTRGGETVSAERAIVQGLGADGGLFVPESFPQVTKYDLRDMAALNYNERAVRILERFLTGFSREQLRGMINAAYARFDDHGVAPLRELPGGVHVMELYHGPTLAFKDVALTLLPHLLTASIYVGIQLLINVGALLIAPDYGYTYLSAVIATLSATYIILIRRYFPLHQLPD